MLPCETVKYLIELTIRIIIMIYKKLWALKLILFNRKKAKVVFKIGELLSSYTSTKLDDRLVRITKDWYLGHRNDSGILEKTITIANLIKNLDEKEDKKIIVDKINENNELFHNINIDLKKQEVSTKVFGLEVGLRF